MLAFGTASAAAGNRRAALVDGFTFHKSEWMDSGSDPALSPTVALIEQPPGYELMPHFHRNNQFQVFIGGTGTIGAHALEPVVVHYAGAYTGYGPLIAGPAGLQYFTMRPVCEVGFIPVSELRDKQIRGPKRHAQSQRLTIAAASELAELAEVADGMAIPLGPDGMGARVVRLPPRAVWTSVHPAGSQGQFVMTMAGSAMVAGRDLDRQWEHAYVTRDEGDVRVQAGAEGLQVLCLHVPGKDPAYSDMPDVTARTGDPAAQTS